MAGRRRTRWQGFVAGALVATANLACAGLRLTVADIRGAGVAVRGIHLVLPDEDGAPGALDIQTLQFGARQWRRLHIRCGSLSLAQGHIRCDDGRLSGPDGLRGARIAFDVDAASASGSLKLQLADGGLVSATRTAGGEMRSSLQRVSLGSLLDLARFDRHGHQVAGRVDGAVRFDGQTWSADLQLAEASFSDADGLHAGEQLAARLQGRFTPQTRGGARWQARLQWQQGEVFWNPVLASAGWSFEARGRIDDDRLEVAAARLQGPGLDDGQFVGGIDLATGRPLDATARFDGLDLAQLGPQLLLPVIAPAHQDRWRLAGQLSGRVRWTQGRPEAGRLDLHDVGFSYLGQRFRVGPLNGTLPWRREAATQWQLDVGGLHWQKLDFAPFALMADLEGTRLRLLPVRLPVLDGAIIVEALSLEMADGQWQGSGHLYSEPISLDRLTEALEWPRMAGTLSLAVPGIQVSPERIGLDGTLVVSVFDGYVQATGLEVTDPFGLLPRLKADISAEHLDLAQLTQTFSFGAVSGFIDANVDALSMARWRPVRFDARVHSSPGHYAKRISQRAVENITALGGGGAMAAIQRSVLRFFNDFGYREIGFSCQLRGNVCQMAGLDGPGPDDAPFMLVRGGGIPGLNVIGYNRRVDWAVLVDRLINATAGEAAPVIE